MYIVKGGLCSSAPMAAQSKWIIWRVELCQVCMSKHIKGSAKVWNWTLIWIYKSYKNMRLETVGAPNPMEKKVEIMRILWPKLRRHKNTLKNFDFIILQVLNWSLPNSCQCKFTYTRKEVLQVRTEKIWLRIIILMKMNKTFKLKW